MSAVTYVAEESFDSPLGRLRLCASDSGLRRIAFDGERDRREWDCVSGNNGRAQRIIDDARRQLGEYFDGERREFDLPLEPIGTDFQVAVWWALQRVAYGSTASYGQQAAWVGRPTAVRAVGGANGRNPLPIVLPCHRIIGANGSITGYSGGLERKVFLLGLESDQVLPVKS